MVKYRYLILSFSVGAEGAVFYFMRCFTFFEKIRLYLTKKVKYNDGKEQKSKVNQIEEV